MMHASKSVYVAGLLNFGGEEQHCIEAITPNLAGSNPLLLTSRSNR